MPLISRHVVTEFLKVFLLALAALTLLIVLGGVIREALMQNLPLGQVVRLVPYILPDALRIAIPVTLLLAATNVYGRMAGMNEIIALKALGISPWPILWPSLFIATLISFLAVWLNDLAVSWGRTGVQRVIVQSVEQIAYHMLQTQRRYSSPLFAINVEQVQGRRLIAPTISLLPRGNMPRIAIRAAEAELSSDCEEGFLRIRLRNGRVDVEGGMSIRFPDEYEQLIPLTQTTRLASANPSPSWLPLRRIQEQIQKQRQQIEQLQEEISREAALALFRGEMEQWATPAWQSRWQRLQEAKSYLARLQTEPHRRWAAGFSCLCFLWVGAPMAIWLRHRDFLTSFFLCFLPILVVYYPLMIYGVDGAKSGTIPPWSVWVANGVLVIWGAWLLRKVFRY
ncbi:MAG: LptF/LptG family permease [Thermoguttaceae bacterium]|nr:LptF/LptG family permease [Thermoguttaceae bacterium]MDW8037949.1 LptF/LptG family permease [Thermoguttaceae bacterium]